MVIKESKIIFWKDENLSDHRTNVYPNGEDGLITDVILVIVENGTLQYTEKFLS